MFSLIITIISIALVTALALATIYYGGSAFRQGGAAAKAAQLINEGQQLSGAAAIASVYNETITVVSDMVPKYLQAAPADWSMTPVVFVYVLGAAFPQRDEVCQNVNVKAGITAAETASATDSDAALVVSPLDATTLIATHKYLCTNTQPLRRVQFAR